MAKLIHLTLEEAAGASSVANTGTVGGAWLKSTAAPTLGGPGKTGLGVDVIGDNARRYLYGDTVFNTLEPTTLTVGVWVYLRAKAGNLTSHVVHKTYRTGADWNNPWTAWAIEIPPNTASVTFSVTTPTASRIAANAGFDIPFYAWTHLALSFDATTKEMRGYINGRVVVSQTLAGGIDYGTHGRMMMGHCNDGSGAIEPLNAIVDELQLYDAVVPVSSFMGDPPQCIFSDDHGHAVDNNTLALWRMDETGGPGVTDETGRYPLMATNTTIADGRFGKARASLPNSNYLSGPGSAAAVTALTGEWTVEAWIWLNVTWANLGTITSYTTTGETTATNTLLAFRVLANRTLQSIWENGAGVDVAANLTDTVLLMARWYHVAARKKLNGGLYDVTFFLNGEPVGTFTGLANASGGTSAIWYVGGTTAINEGFNGSIDDVRVSTVPRLDEEIKASYEAGVSWNGGISKPHAAPDWTQTKGGGRGGKINGGFN